MATVDSSQQAPSGSQTVLCRNYSYRARGSQAAELQQISKDMDMGAANASIT